MSSSTNAASAPFIVIEGLDGAGTTTQCQRLVERLRENGHRATVTREPSDGPVGAMIRQMLSRRVVAPDGQGGVEPVDDDVLALLFAADRLDHVSAEIEPAADDGTIVVSDRYYHSSFAYQGEQRDEEFDFEWVRRLNERARRPDLTVFLEVSTDTCLERMSDRATRDIYENRQRLEALEGRYRSVIERLAAEGEPIETVDAEQSIAEVAEAIWSAVESRLP
jgi:dTMP kinase